MHRLVSGWPIALALSLSGGCYLDHGPALAPARDGGPAGRADSGSIAPDAGVELDACAQIVARIRAGEEPTSIGCGRGFLPIDCRVPVGECCVAEIECAIEPTDGGHVVVQLWCDDSCDQSCGAQPREECGFWTACEWFDDGACGPGVEGAIEGPICAPRRMGECAGGSACPDGLTCREYWINPCAGMSCDACGGTQSYCAP